MSIIVGILTYSTEWSQNKIFREYNEIVFCRCFSYELFGPCEILLRIKLIDCKLHDGYFQVHCSCLLFLPIAQERLRCIVTRGAHDTTAWMNSRTAQVQVLNGGAVTCAFGRR